MNAKIEELKALKSEIEGAGNALTLAAAMGRVMGMLIDVCEAGEEAMKTMDWQPCQDCGRQELHPDDLPDAGALVPDDQPQYARPLGGDTTAVNDTATGGGVAALEGQPGIV